MSSYQELNSFLSKFFYLLHCGKRAKLVLECDQGQANVNLHHTVSFLPLEPHSYHQQHGQPVRRQGPSRQRRRARRAVARTAAEAAKASGAKAETASKISDVVAQTTDHETENVSLPPCPAHLHQGIEQGNQAVQAGPPPPHPHHEQAAKAVPLPPQLPASRHSASKLSSTAVQMLPLRPTNISITTLQSNEPIYHQDNNGEQLTQLDGFNEHLPNPDQTFKCETCGKVFETVRDYKNHDSFQFCCDDCGICFSTQLAAHFHELEEHADSHYAKTYIPETTKLLFRSNQPKNIL